MVPSYSNHPDLSRHLYFSFTPGKRSEVACPVNI